MDYTKILLKPLISEKATLIKAIGNQVIFLVSPGTNKLEVKYGVEEAFRVNVLAVNIARKRPLIRRRHGKSIGHVPGFKKAYVTLAVGDRIAFFEGV